MNLNQPTLVEFESARKSAGLIPPAGSNSFYNIGNGRINILTKRSEKDDYRFDIFTDRGEIDIGDGAFNLAGDINNIEYPYGNMTIRKNTSINITNMFGIYRGEMKSHGTINIRHGAHIVVRNSGRVILHKESSIYIDAGVGFQVHEGSEFTIYGKIYINLNSVHGLLNAPNVTIDPAATMFVTGLETLGQRLYSLTDYFAELSNQVININTQGEKNFIRSIGRIGYVWSSGNPLKRYQVIKMSVLYGIAILGDFKLSILGMPEVELPDTQIVDTIVIEKGSTLYISDTYEEYQYAYPQLYLGIVIDNSKIAGRCIVNGKVIVSGKDSSITLDRGASLTIEEDAEVELCNGGTILSSHNDEMEVLFIFGRLIIDDLSQIESFISSNIVFGENGKLVIRNPDTGEKRVLFSTPHGINDTMLYKMMHGKLDHVEYHISNNTGICIDQYYELFHKDFIHWYNGMRIEKAIHEGLIVWHDGGFIKLSSDVIPWVNDECNLLHASRLFKSFGSSDYEKLQEVVDRLKYAGCGNITFIFEYDGGSHEMTLILNDVNMISVINNPISNSYELKTDNSGELFLKNNLPIVTPETIITKNSTMINIKDNNTAVFAL